MVNTNDCKAYYDLFEQMNNNYTFFYFSKTFGDKYMSSYINRKYLQHPFNDAKINISFY